MHIHILKHANIGSAERYFRTLAIARGHRVTIVDPRNMKLTTASEPDVVFARCEIGSFSEPIFSDYLAALHCYERAGIPIVNRQHFMLVGQDKFLSHLAIDRALEQSPIPGCATPKTDRVSTQAAILNVVRAYGDQFGGAVLKDPCGSRGEGVVFLQSGQTVHDRFQRRAGAVLVQEPINKEQDAYGRCRDFRLEVVRHPDSHRPFISRAYARIGAPGEFLTNITRGGAVEPLRVIPPNLAQFAALVLDATGGDIAGIDIARDVQGVYWFEEVNIAFETNQKNLDLLGDRIWHDALRLVLARGAQS